MGAVLLLLLGGLALGALASGGDDGEEATDTGRGDGARNTGDGDPDGRVSREGDTIMGSAGDDVIIVADDPVVIFTGAGDDFVRSGDEPDFVSDFAEGNPPGDDTIYGGQGADTLLGSSGEDALYGGTQNDLLNAIDRVDGTPNAPDLVSGGWGEDTLVGDDGDTLTGGEGADIFAVASRDAEAEAPVTIADFEPGDFLQVEIYDPALLRNDGSDVIELVDLATDGVGLVVNDIRLATVQGLTAADLGSDDYAVIDFTT